MINSIARLLTIALVLLLAIGTLPVSATSQWNSGSREEAERNDKDGKK